MRELESEIAVSRTENIRLKMLFRLKLFYEKWRGILYSGVLYSGVFVFFLVFHANSGTTKYHLNGSRDIPI